MANIKEVQTDKAPKAVGPYSQGVETEQFIFVSGQLPVDPDTGKIVEKNIKKQTAKVLENILSILDHAGVGVENVVRCDVFLLDMNDFQAMNEVYASKFTSDPKPARQAFQVGRLPLDALVEISCIAVKNQNG